MSIPLTAITLFAGVDGWDTGFAACGVPILAALNHKDQIVGTFRGFSQGGLEFHADIVLPYKDASH